MVCKKRILGYYGYPAIFLVESQPESVRGIVFNGFTGTRDTADLGGSLQMDSALGEV